MVNLTSQHKTMLATASAVLLLLELMLASSPSALATESHAVRNHIRKDGTFVERHRQTNPNRSKLDNWSTKGNTNPHTGKQGTVDPYRPKLKRTHK